MNRINRDSIFEWDPEKAKENYRKHGVRFEVAMNVFEDERRLEIFDKEHSTRNEYRYIVIGLADDVLYVIYTERCERIRLISARLATIPERNLYYDYAAYFIGTPDNHR